MSCQSVLGIVIGEQTACTQIVDSLWQQVRHHVDIAPVGIVLSILHDGQVDARIFLPDGGEKGQREIRDFVRTLRARAMNTLETASAAAAALEQVGNQTEVE